jgi:hypothetical protein
VAHWPAFATATRLTNSRLADPRSDVNAIHNATCIRIRDLPVTSDKLLREMH